MMKKNLFKVFAFLLLFILLLVGCTVNHPNTSENPAETSEQDTSEPLESGNASASAGGYLSPTYFYRFEDLKTFLTTGSEDPSDYSAEHPPHSLQGGVRYYWPYLKGEYLDVVTVFGMDENLADSLKYILVYESGVYFVFYSGLEIFYSYSVDQKDDTSPQMIGTTLRSDLTIENLSQTPLTENQRAAHTVGNHTIVYGTSFHEKDGLSFLINMSADLVVDGFRVQINLNAGRYQRYVTKAPQNEAVDINENTFEELLGDPIFESIAPFFTDGAEREIAFAAMIQAIESRESIR